MIITDERAARFVSQRLGLGLCPPFTCMGIERGGRIIAGVIVHCFEGASVHVTVAGTGWTRGFLKAVGAYVYTQLGCLRVTITTEREAVAQLAERLGGKREGVLRDQFGRGRDGIVIGILESEYRFR